MGIDSRERPISKLNLREARWLQTLTSAVRASLDHLRADPVVRFADQAAYPLTETWGYQCNLASFRGDRTGAVDLWLDWFPNVGRPILCVSYRSNHSDRVDAIASANGGRPKPSTCESESRHVAGGKVIIMACALPRSFFERPVVEHLMISYYSVYLRDTVETAKTPSRALVAKVARISSRLIHAVAAVSAAASRDTADFPAVENRRRVVNHLERERSSALARKVKARDGFTCQICEFNFAEVYGNLARGYAEAHHRTPLAKLKDVTVTVASDLITVCANCHRALHMMRGEKDDIRRLRRTLARR